MDYWQNLNASLSMNQIEICSYSTEGTHDIGGIRHRPLLYKNQRGGVGVIVLLAMLLIVGLVLPFFPFGKVVKPNEIGVRQNAISFLGLLGEGYGEKGLDPGLHWQLPPFSKIITLPRGFQYVHFNVQPSTPNKDVTKDVTVARLDVNTNDGVLVRTDVTLVVRYFDKPSTEGSPALARELVVTSPSSDPLPPFVTYEKKSCGGPAMLMSKLVVGGADPLERVSEVARGAIKDAMGVLTAESYYNPAARESQAQRAQYYINRGRKGEGKGSTDQEGVNFYGVDVWSLLVRRYTYLDPNIDEQIFRKNLQDQQESFNAAQSELKGAEAKTEEVLASWDAKVRNLTVEGDSGSSVILSEGERYKARQLAEGDYFIRKAEAEVTTQKNELYSNVDGAQMYLAQQMAPLVSTLKGGVVSDIDPYDLEAWIDRLVGSNKADPK